MVSTSLPLPIPGSCSVEAVPAYTGAMERSSGGLPQRRVPRRMRRMIPDHVWTLAAPYGLHPRTDETTSPGDGTNP